MRGPRPIKKTPLPRQWKSIFAAAARRERRKAKRSKQPPAALMQLQWNDFSIKVIDPSHRNEDQWDDWRREVKRAYEWVLQADFEYENLDPQADILDALRRYSPGRRGPRQFYFVIAEAADRPVGVLTFWFFPRSSKQEVGYVCVDYLALCREWRPSGSRKARVRLSHRERVLIANGLLLPWFGRWLRRNFKRWTWLIFECEKIDWRNTGADLSELSLRVKRIDNFLKLADKASHAAHVGTTDFDAVLADGLRELAVAYFEPPVAEAAYRPPRPVHLLLGRNRTLNGRRYLTRQEAIAILRHVYLVWYGGELLPGEQHSLTPADRAYLDFMKLLLQRVEDSLGSRKSIELTSCDPLAVPVMKSFGGSPTPDQDRHLDAIKKALTDPELSVHLRARRVDEYPGFPGVPIDEKGKFLIDTSPLVIFDLYQATHNVWVELGYAAAALSQPYIILLVPRQEEETFRRNVYFRQYECVSYDADNLDTLTHELVRRMKQRFHL